MSVTRRVPRGVRWAGAALLLAALAAPLLVRAGSVPAGTGAPPPAPDMVPMAGPGGDVERCPDGRVAMIPVPVPRDLPLEGLDGTPDFSSHDEMVAWAEETGEDVTYRPSLEAVCERFRAHGAPAP